MPGLWAAPELGVKARTRLGRALALLLENLFQQDDDLVVQGPPICIGPINESAVQVRREAEPQVLDLSRLLDGCHGGSVTVAVRACQVTVDLTCGQSPFTLIKDSQYTHGLAL